MKIKEYEKEFLGEENSKSIIILRRKGYKTYIVPFDINLILIKSYKLLSDKWKMTNGIYINIKNRNDLIEFLKSYDYKQEAF